jgi:hypothetical protein
METNNKLIAEFLEIGKQLHLYENPITGDYEDELLFDTDWNWLMKAVEKCLTKLDTYNVTTNEHYNNIHDSLWSINITEVYKAVVEFIKFHNEQ